MADLGGSPGPGRLSDAEVEESLADLDGLLAEVEAIPGRGGEAARDAVSALAAVYGEALARTVATAGPGAARRLAADPLVGHLLALHGLHPDPPEQRAARAVADIGGQLHGGGVELTGVEDGVARVTLAEAGCGSGQLAASVRDIVIAAAPELNEVQTATAPATSAFIPVQALHRPRRP